MLKRFSTVVAGLVRHRKSDPGVPVLWVMTDEHRLPDPTAILRTLPAGSGLIVRHNDAQKRRSLATQLWPICKARRIKMLISDDWRTCHALRADGVHVPETKVTAVRSGLRLWRKNTKALLSCAAHSATALRKAKDCDFVFLSSVFPTHSHPGRESLGRLRYARLARTSHKPVMALGGIHFGNVRALNGTQTAGVAGIGFAANER